MKWIRRLLFFTLLAGYLALCPFILLYTLGIVIRPAAEESIVKTGVLFVASAPAGASILLNDRPNPKDTPAAIVDLPPGSYQLRLQLAGYREWSRTLTVKESSVTLADDILMIPENWVSTKISPEAFSTLTSLGGSAYVLLRKSSRLEELYVYSLPENRLAPVLEEGSPKRGALIRSLTTMSGSSAFLVETVKAGERTAYMASIQWPKTVLKDVTQLIPASYDRIEWSPSYPDDLFVQHGGRIDWIRISTATVRNVMAKGAMGFGVAGRDLYVLETDGTLSKIDSNDGSRNPLRSFKGMPIGFLPNPPIRIVQAGSGIFLLHGSNGTFSAALPEARTTIGGVRSFTVDWSTGTVLLWKADRLGLLELWEPQETRTISKPEPVREPEWIWTGGTDIRQAFFVHRASHVLFQDRNRTFIVSPDFGTGERTVTEIVALQPGTSVHYADREGRLIRLEERTQQVTRTEIVPRTTVMREFLQDIGDRYGF